MNFWNKICGIVLFLIISGLSLPAQSITLPLVNPPFLIKNTLNNSGSHYFMSPRSAVTGLYNLKQIVPADFYTCNIGFFCKKELLIEKATKIPLRFRLGSLQQCNYYEGKK